MKVADHDSLRKFLAEQAAATLAVAIDEAGNLHAASLLFYHTEEPLRFFFVTSRSSEKYSLLNERDSTPCAVVVGTERGTEFTLQMRGVIEEVDPNEYTNVVDEYYKKRGNRQDDVDDEGTCLLKFTPNWARFTDYAVGYEHKFLDL